MEEQRGGMKNERNLMFVREENKCGESSESEFELR